MRADIGALPTPPTSIIGREREAGDVLSMLDRGDLRVLTLLGPGGVGKTRLALEVGDRIAPSFAHGAVFIPLETVRDPGLVAMTVAKALGLQESPDRPETEALIEKLADQHMLLIIDNFEQVISAATWLADLLAQCPRTTALVTSRIALDIGGEQRYVVPPLPVPDIGDTQSPAVDLFVERGRAVNVDFAMDEQAADAVAEICRRLDGLPLAIELAAARVDILPPKALLERLAHQLTALSGRRRDVHARLQSMREAIRWSYDLLAPEEQRLFRRLAVFDGFTLDAAAFVAAWPDSPVSDLAAMDLVHSLVSQSLVRPLDDPVDARFRMLETIREFGVDQLAECGELQTARDKHAAYYLSLAHAAQAGLTGPGQVTWLERLEIEHGNLREAMEWLTSTGRVSDALGMYIAIEYVFLVHAWFAEARRLLDAWSSHPDVSQAVHARARFLTVSAKLAMYIELPESPLPTLLEALELSHQTGDRRLIMETLTWLSYAYASVGDNERFSISNREQSALARELGDARCEAAALDARARLEMVKGDLRQARSASEASLAIAREAGDLPMIALSTGRLGSLVLQMDGNVERARTLLEEARSIRERLGDKRNLPLVYIDLAEVERISRNIDLARKHGRKAMSLAQDSGLLTHEGAAHIELGRIALLQHDLDHALLELRQALKSFRGAGAGFSPEVADGLDLLAELALEAGDAEFAARFLSASDGLIGRAGLPRRTTWPADHREALVERVRATLGEETFERCHGAASDWSQDEAISESLGFEPPLYLPEHGEPPANPHGLSPREIEVLALMADGCSNQQIADALYLSLRTIATHVTHILAKLDVTSRTAAVAFAIRNGLA